jgi:hypothetical protein
MTELDLETPKPKAKPKARELGLVTIVSRCKKHSMKLMEGSREIENLLSNGWKVKKGK